MAGFCFRPFRPRGGSLAPARLIKAATRRLRRLHPLLYRPVTHNLQARWFDPLAEDGPQRFDLYHVNNVSVDKSGLYVSGAGLDGLFRVRGARVERIADLPLCTHNACRQGGRLIYHDTLSGRVSMSSPADRQPRHFSLPRYAADRLVNGHLRRDHARQRFGRGLCTHGDLLIAGSSPATVCVFAPGCEQPRKALNLTLDLRNAIHGVEIWPFDRHLADWQARCRAATAQSPANAPACANPAPVSPVSA